MKFLLPLILLLISQALPAAWVLDSAQSSLNYISTKKGHVMEAGNTFTSLQGRIDEKGMARVEIVLDTVESLVPIRNQRMRQYLFQTDHFPKAVFSASIDSAPIQSLAPGEERLMPVAGQLELHGHSGRIATQLRVTALANGSVMVQSTVPIILNALDYALGEGINKLKELAGLSAISTSVPVSFSLVFRPE